MKGLLKRNDVWWIDIQVNGERFRKSCETSSQKKAEELLLNIRNTIREGRFAELKAKNTSYAELRADLIIDYQINKKRSLDRLQRSIGHLDTFFEGTAVSDITTDFVKSYILQRQKEGAANATINRELAALKRMLNLGHKTTPPKVIYVPYIPKLAENNIREGYYEEHEFRTLIEALPAYLKPVVTMAYFTGMRKQEMLGLKWDQVNLYEGKITLGSKDTKNKESRIIFMDGELLGVIKDQREFRDEVYPDTPWVFFGDTGQQIRDFRFIWKKVCKKNDLEGKTLHDFRRTAIRNMVRNGIPEKIAMMISGHKTRSVFDRYNIVNEKDLKLAAKKISEGGKKSECHKNVTIEEIRSGLSCHTRKSSRAKLKLIQ